MLVGVGWNNRLSIISEAVTFTRGNRRGAAPRVVQEQNNGHLSDIRQYYSVFYVKVNTSEICVICLHTQMEQMFLFGLSLASVIDS